MRDLITHLSVQDSGLGSPVDENPPMQRYHEATKKPELIGLEVTPCAEAKVVEFKFEKYQLNQHFRVDF